MSGSTNYSPAALAAAAAAALPPRVDVLLWGATSFAGFFVVEYAAKRYGPGAREKLTFALGGRNREKLEQLRDKIAAEYSHVKTWPLFVGDSLSQRDMDEVVPNARIVATTVGPYSRYGMCLVDACVRYNVDYLDLTGEPSFYKTVMRKYHEAAQAKGVFIVPCCGFDCIPADLGAMMAEDTARETLLRDIDYMYTAFGPVKGAGIGGGTLASTASEFENPDWESLRNPQIFAPGRLPRRTPHDGDQIGIRYIRALRTFTVPFLLAIGDIRVVNRSQYLRGKDYSYSEGLGLPNIFAAVAGWVLMSLIPIVMTIRFTRNLVLRLLPQPGEGPSRKSVEQASFRVRTVAVCKKRDDDVEPRRVFVTLHARRDPGFGATARMMVESAVTIALHKRQLQQELPSGMMGGVLTPSVALGRRLVERLQENADFAYQIRFVQPPIMPHVGSFDDFALAAQGMVDADPLNTRCVVRFRHVDALVEIKVTNDKECVKFQTDQLQDLKRFDKLSKTLFRTFAGVPPDFVEPDDAPAAQPAPSPAAPAPGGKSKKRK